MNEVSTVHSPDVEKVLAPLGEARNAPERALYQVMAVLGEQYARCAEEAAAMTDRLTNAGQFAHWRERMTEMTRLMSMIRAYAGAIKTYRELSYLL